MPENIKKLNQNEYYSLLRAPGITEYKNIGNWSFYRVKGTQETHLMSNGSSFYYITRHKEDINTTPGGLAVFDFDTSYWQIGINNRGMKNIGAKVEKHYRVIIEQYCPEYNFFAVYKDYLSKKRYNTAVYSLDEGLLALPMEYEMILPSTLPNNGVLFLYVDRDGDEINYQQTHCIKMDEDGMPFVDWMGLRQYSDGTVEMEGHTDHGKVLNDDKYIEYKIDSRKSSTSLKRWYKEMPENHARLG